MTRARTAAQFVFAAFALAIPSLAGAQTNPPVTFDITPATAGPGVKRQISINVPWPSGCLPTGATVVSNESVRKRAFTIRLDGALQNSTRCGDIIVSYHATVQVTPNAEGDLRALAVSGDGIYLGETTLHTRAAGSDRSQYDLTGMWYDPASYGSGLTFVHGFARGDSVFGTWYVYDALGIPRWYTIQGVQWKAGGLQADGLIYETGANLFGCQMLYLPCPLTYAIVRPLAQARIVMQAPNSARIQAVTNEGAVLFTSNIVRSIF